MKLVFDNKDLVSTGEAAKALGVTAMTLHRWIEAGKVMAVKVGAYRAIPRSEIERLRGSK